MTALNAGVTAFRETYMDADTLDFTDDSNWSDFAARRLRYDLMWAYFQGNAYRSIHRWSKKMKADYGLYKYTRDLYNPAFRLGSFYRSYLWGGRLDMLAGDGQQVPNGLPIITERTELRQSISQLWRDSNWKTQRKLVPLFGSLLGDVLIQAIDDPLRGKVYLKPVHPGIMASIEKDPFGNIKGYVIQYERTDPEAKGVKTAVYTETVSREGDNVVYELEKDGKPYHWGHTDEQGTFIDNWAVPYGFVPMVHIEHFSVGLEWGMSELFPKLSVFREVDDQCSKLNDQVRKMVDAPWLFAGVKEPKSTPNTQGASPSSTRPDPGREEMPVLYTPEPQAKAHPLVAPLDIEHVTDKITRDLEELEKDYPELSLLRAMNQTDELSGSAIERLQAQSSEKVQDYRDGYDDALVRVQQMAVAIGGWREYEGYDAFNLESYDQGDLEHQIGQRPVFTQTAFQKAELEAKQATATGLAVKAGWPLIEYLRSIGINEAALGQIESSPQYRAKLAALQSVLLVGDEGEG